MQSANKTVLVLEPDHETRVFIREHLEKSGYIVVSVTNAGDAMKAFEQSGAPCLILMATNLGGITAERFLKMLANHPAYKKIPVAQLIGTGESALQDVSLTLQKPVSGDQLKSILSKC